MKSSESIDIFIFSLVNECENVNCSGRGNCSDGRNYFFCLCNDGFTGKECEKGNMFNINFALLNINVRV